MFDWIYRRYRGFVLISLEGCGIERFFNLVNARGIYIWDVATTCNKTTFYMYVSDVKKLKEILRKTRTKMCIVERCGLPFFLFWNRKRKMFLAGMLTGWFLVYIMSMYVWNISFEGNVRHTDDELLKYMTSIKVFEGMKKSTIRPEEIEKAIRNQYFDITWSSVEVSGTMLKIHIRENNSQVGLENNEKIENNIGDVISNKDATVVSIVTRSGTPLVKIGQEVKLGDTLIAGKYDILADDLTIIEERQVKADGDIVGKVIYSVSEEIGRKYTKKIYTGNTMKLNHIKCENELLEVKLPWVKVNYEKYDTMDYSKPLSVGENFYLPVETGITEYREYEIFEAEYSEEELKILAEEKIKYILKKIEENTIQIIENNVKIEVNEKGCVISGDITVLEYIGSLGATDE